VFPGRRAGSLPELPVPVNVGISFDRADQFTDAPGAVGQFVDETKDGHDGCDPPQLRRR